MSKINREAIEKLRRICTELLREDAAFEKARIAAGQLPVSATVAQRGRVNNKMLSCAEQIESLKHEAHCLAVEARIADARDAADYGRVVKKPNGWHDHAWDRRAPATPDQCFDGSDAHLLADDAEHIATALDELRAAERACSSICLVGFREVKEARRHIGRAMANLTARATENQR